jgi:transposase
VFQHRLLLSEYDHLTRTVREPLEHLTRVGSALRRRAASLVSLPAGEPTGHRPLYSQVLASTARAEVDANGCVRDLQPDGGLTANNAALGQKQ